MSITLFLSLAFAHLVAVISPGPDFFYTIRNFFEKGVKNSVIASLGIGFGVFLQCLFSILGLSVLYELFPTLYLFIGTLGAIYLVYLGVSGLFGSTTKADSTTRKGLEKLNFWRSFGGGLIVNILNVKAFIFFAALFGGLIGKISVLFQILISFYFFGATALWFTFLTISLSFGGEYFLRTEVQNIITRLSSICIVLVGLGIGFYVWI